MIRCPTMYTTRYGLSGAEQKLLDLAWEIRRTGRSFHPGHATLARWLARSTRQVERYLDHLRSLKLLSWQRRGKKLCNVYYLGAALWRTLMKGRRFPGAVKEVKPNSPVDRETAKRLLAEIVASIPGAG
jgi:hypothetical protein